MWSSLPVLLVATGLALPARTTPAGRPHVDPDAMREAGGEGPTSSARAIAHYLAARRCQENADWQCTARELEQAVGFDHTSAELRVALAEALALVGQVPQAEVEARNALELSPVGGPVATRAHVLVAQLVAGRDREQAALELRLAIQCESSAAEAGERPAPTPWRLLAVLYLDMGEEEAAGRVLDDLAARAPGESEAVREVGRWFLERGRPGRAEAFLRRAVAASRQDVEARRLLARVHHEQGRPLELRADLEGILELQPGDPDALFELGCAALGDDDLARARDRFLQYQQVAADRSQAAARVATQWLDAGRPDEALDVARAAGDEAPVPQLQLAEGLALLRLRRWAEAAQALRRIGPEDAETFVPARAALAGALARTGRFQEAERALAAPLRELPADRRLVLARASVLERAGDAEGFAELRTARAEVLCRAGRAAEAVASLEPAVAARPRAAALRLALAAALREAGAPGHAAAELRALLALEPDQPEAMARLASLLVDSAAPGSGGGSSTQSAGAEAEGLARRAAQLRPRSAEAVGALGRALSLRGDHPSAIAALERAVLLSGRDPRVLDELGEAYRAAGRPREAAAAWRRALASAADEVPGVAERLRSALQRKLRDGRALAQKGPERR